MLIRQEHSFGTEKIHAERFFKIIARKLFFTVHNEPEVKLPGGAQDSATVKSPSRLLKAADFASFGNRLVN